MQKKIDDCAEALNQLSNTLGKFVDILENLNEMGKMGYLSNRNLNLQICSDYEEKSNTIFDRQFVMNQEHYEHVLKYHYKRSFYMVIINASGEILFEKNNGLLLLLSKVYRGGFLCKENIVSNSDIYKEYILDKIWQNWREIINVRFGLESGVVVSQNDITRVFSLSMNEVRKIEKMSIHRVRRCLEKVIRKKSNGRIERERKNILLTIGEKESKEIRIEPISCKLVDFMKKREISNLKEIDSYMGQLSQYGLLDEAVKLQSLTQKRNV